MAPEHSAGWFGKMTLAEKSAPATGIPLFVTRTEIVARSPGAYALRSVDGWTTTPAGATVGTGVDVDVGRGVGVDVGIAVAVGVAEGMAVAVGGTLGTGVEVAVGSGVGVLGGASWMARSSLRALAARWELWRQKA